MAIFNNTNPLKFNPNTPIKYYYKKTEYVPGKGNITVWKEIKSDDYTVFYCEFKTMYGDRALSAEALGVKHSATIRTFYNPIIKEKLERVQTLIVKNLDDTAFVDGKPDKNCPNLFEVWGGVDNVLEENQFMEFRVRRYEGW